MSDKTLRRDLLRLAHENSELRPHLLPLLRKQAMWSKVPARRMYQEGFREMGWVEHPRDPDLAARIVQGKGDLDGYWYQVPISQADLKTFEFYGDFRTRRDAEKAAREHLDDLL